MTTGTHPGHFISERERERERESVCVWGGDLQRFSVGE